MKKDGWASTSAEKREFPFSLISSGATGDSYGNVFLRCQGTDSDSGRLYFHAKSGSVVDAAYLETGLSDLADSKWHHYALTFKKYGSKNRLKFYFDGEHKETNELTSPVSEITGALHAAIGAMAGPWDGGSGSDLDAAAAGWGNVVSCSFDEFRYWKTERTAQQIGRYYRDQLGGGTNTDNVKYNDVVNKVDLGVYFKFNEGSTGIESTDETILDTLVEFLMVRL